MKLNKIYEQQKENVDGRLNEFRKLGQSGTDEELFTEMVFCMCTPQTKAHAGWGAAKELRQTGALVNGSKSEIENILKKNGVRFHINKTKYIIDNREKFYPQTRQILEQYLKLPPVQARNQLQKHVKGWGMKEASHFLRNIGFGSDIAILDRHILRCLSNEGVLQEEYNLNKEYIDIENKMREYASRISVPLDALDLVIWYDTNGEIFK